MNRDKLTEIAFAIAKSQGFYETKRSDEYYISLIIGEMFEVLSAIRASRYADLIRFQKHQNFWYKKICQENAYLNYVKDTVEDEFADVLILIASVAGYKGISLSGNINKKYRRNYKNFSAEENIFAFIRNATRPYNEVITLQTKLRFLFDFVENWMSVLGIDILTHVAMKIDYNKTRGTLHGKSY